MSGVEIQEDSYEVKVGFTHSPYDTDEKSIHLRGKATFGKLQEVGEEHTLNNPFYLDLHVVARFQIDEEQFDVTYIEDWAKSNAPMLVMPYLREHVSSLCIRCGFPSVNLPLIQVPRYKDDQTLKKDRDAD